MLKIYTLEDFLNEFPYKVGDEVWLHFENLTTIIPETITCMRWCNKYNCVLYDVLTCCNLRECAFTPYKEKTMKDKPDLLQQLKEYFDNTPREVIEKEWHEYDKYNEISPKVNEYLEYVNNIRQPQYPKTYEECCKVLFPNTIELGKVSAYGYNGKLLEKFGELIICRNAYWKIAREEMGVGKSWEPNWKDDSDKYFICYLKDELWMSNIRDCNRLLVFPTKEMRDVFYDNFKELIENCKELL